MSGLPTVTPEWLRALADLVEKRKVDVIKCEPKTGGVLLGVVEPQPLGRREKFS